MKKLIFLAVMPLLLLPLYARGQDKIIDGSIQPLSYQTDLSKEEFIQATRNVSETPAGDKFLAFKLRLPKDWQKVEGKPLNSGDLSNKLLGEIIRYVSPPQGDKRAEFVMRAVKLDYFISTKNWFLNYVRVNGFALQGLDVKYPNRIQGEYVVFKDGVSYLVRAVVQRNGDRIIMAEYMIPPGMKGDARGFQAWAMHSFRLVNADNVNPIELKQFGLLDLGGFYYPADWSAAAVGDRSLDRMVASLIKTSKDPTKRERRNSIRFQDGAIETYYLSKKIVQNPENQIAKLKAALIEKNMEIAKPLYTIERERKGQQFKAMPMEAYALNIMGGRFVDYEFWVTYNETPNAYFISTLITPARNTDFLEWAKNIAALDVVASSLQLY